MSFCRNGARDTIRRCATRWEYTLAFIGLGAWQSTSRTLTVTTDASDSDDRIRRRLATALSAGLLTYLAPDRIPEGLDVTATFDAADRPQATADADPWRRWIFSLNGNLDLDSEQSTTERNFGVSVGADHITPDWKLTFGSRFNENRDEFDFDDDDEPDGRTLAVVRKDWSFNGLVVRSLGDHWSFGMTGQLRSSTFANIDADLRLAPALE